MNKVKGGRHCEQCNKTVWDTAQLTRNQFRVRLMLSRGDCCIRETRTSDGELIFRNDPYESAVTNGISATAAMIALAATTQVSQISDGLC